MKNRRQILFERVVIPVLLCVLAYVLYTNFSGNSEDENQTAANQVQAGPKPSPAPPAVVKWVRQPAEEIAAFNPFERPRDGAPADQIAVSEQNSSAVRLSPSETENPRGQELRKQQEAKAIAELKALLSQPVAMWTVSGNRTAVVIGEQVVREGDVIAGLVRIVKLRPTEMTVELVADDLPPLGVPQHP